VSVWCCVVWQLVLGLLWTIILRFAIAEDGKQGLLLWAQRSTEVSDQDHDGDDDDDDHHEIKAIYSLLARPPTTSTCATSCAH
jgi:hypothetical protein